VEKLAGRFDMTHNFAYTIVGRRVVAMILTIEDGQTPSASNMTFLLTVCDTETINENE